MKVVQYLCIVVFITLYSMVFGAANSLTGVTVVCGVMVLFYVDLGICPKQATVILALIYPFTAILAYLTQFNVWLAIPIHFVCVLVLLTLTGMPLASKVYMTFLLNYVFTQGNPVWGRDFWLRLAGLTLAGLVTAAMYYLRHRNTPQRRTVRMVVEETFRPSQRRNFLFRMAVGITIAATVAGLLHVRKPMWASIVVCSLTQPFHAETHQRIVHRVTATLVGCILFYLLFECLIPAEYKMYVLMFLGFVYSFIKQYKYQQIFTVLSVLGAATPIYGVHDSIGMRVALLLVGVLIVAIVDQFDLHVIKRWNGAGDPGDAPDSVEAG